MMIYEYPPKNSKLLLPEDIEKETIESTVRINGEMLNYDKHTPYNEIVITNMDKNMYPIAVFANVLGNQDYSQKVKKAKQLSERLGIPFIEIDKTVCREKMGLPPLTEKEDKMFQGEMLDI